MISGFMTLKNVLTSGYPFVEAISSILPICDELLISEGYSTDGTFTVLKNIANVNKKVKIFRQEWPTNGKYTDITEVTNIVRAKCKYDYIFSIQANEIIHEDDVTLIKALPEICPQITAFTLPFIHLVKGYKFYEDFRLRLAKNLDNIVAVSDAWTLGVSESFITSEIRKTIFHPRRLRQYINKGVEWTFANTCSSSLSRSFYLPKPIYRYWSLFPRDYIEKCQKHMEMFSLNNLKQDVALLQNHVDDPELFWAKAVDLRRKELGFNYPGDLGLIKLSDHPKIVRDLLSDSSSKSYYVRDDVLTSLKDL